MSTPVSIDLQSAAFISAFGRDAVEDSVIQRATGHLESSPVGRLASLMAEILHALDGADPRRLAKKPGFFTKLTGGHLHMAATVAVSKDALEIKISDADPVAAELEHFLANVDASIDAFRAGTMKLTAQLEAGRAYLRDNPEAGKPQETHQFDNPRERFSRRLTNMATLVASNEMTEHQLRLSKAQALDMLDRYREIREVLLPVWRQHQLAMANQRLLDPISATKAIQAHEAMQRAVAETLKGLPSASSPPSSN